MIEDEVWKYIPDFPDYAISTYGRVASLRFKRMVVPRRGTDGAQRVTLYCKTIRSDMYVHQLMARAFTLGHEYGDPVGHTNGFRDDNHIGNLYFHTYFMGWSLEPDLEYDGKDWHRLW